MDLGFVFKLLSNLELGETEFTNDNRLNKVLTIFQWISVCSGDAEKLNAVVDDETKVAVVFVSSAQKS